MASTTISPNAGCAQPAAKCQLFPNNVAALSRQSSLVGEIFRYQVVGPPHFGLTNLRTVQDWIAAPPADGPRSSARSTPGAAPPRNSKSRPILHKLEAYNITLPRLIAAIGNANINVGGRKINIGQQSVNIRGVGLIDSGGPRRFDPG